VGTSAAAVFDFEIPEGEKGDQGDPGTGINPRGDYNGATAYAAGDSVSYLGSSYVAISSTTGNLPTNATFWQVMAEKGADGNSIQVFNQADTPVSASEGDLWIVP
jgi:hypothetical protein